MSRVKQLVLQAAQEGNILTLTSACNVNCVFCSNRQNPPGVEVYSMPPLSFEEMEETASFLDPGKKIVIGESVTRICEGEPFTHPQIRDILTYLREKFPVTTLQLTTNGTFLDPSTVSFLGSLAPLEIILSLNTSDAKRRFSLMHDQKAETAVMGPILLKEGGIPFHGSLVAVPFITGWDDIRESVAYLAENGARTVRVFLPGYTKLAPAELQFDLRLWDELQDFIAGLRQKISVPVLCEPTFVDNLTPEILGVIAESPAEAAGLARGDIIACIDNTAVFSRVDAFNRLREKGGSIEIGVSGRQTRTLQKKAGEPSGVVMAYDIAPEMAGDIDRLLRRHGAWQALALASVPGAALVEKALAAAGVMGEVRVVPVPSIFFGGSIMAAGLLTVEDFLAAAARYLQTVDAKPGLLILPAIAFDRFGRDLTGRSYLEMEQALGIPAALV